MKMIKTNNLKLCYDEKIILDDINIEIRKRENYSVNWT